MTNKQKKELVEHFEAIFDILAQLDIRSSQSLTAQIDQLSRRCDELEQQRRRLFFVLCRVLPSARGYRLRPSELASDIVGDRSFLSQETQAYLLMRMAIDSHAQSSKEGI